MFEVKQDDITIPVVREVATVRKRIVERERVIIRKTVDEQDQTVQAVLRHQDVTVEHVAVGRVVDAVPAIREVDGVTVIPMVEERLVVRTELFLREELHIRKAVRMQPMEQTVRLRREVVAIERHETPHNILGETPMSMTDATYDPALHEDQVVALYETHAEAQAALDKLTTAGLAEGAHISDHSSATATGAVAAEDEGIWSSIKKLFVPEEEATGYAEGLRRGHALLIVHPTAATREHVIQVLDSTNPIDFDSKVEEWRGAGWTGGTMATTATATTTATTGVTGATGLAAQAPAVGLAAGDSLKVMEERLRVGKRDVERGGVRVRSYIVERPVEESVTLREESIHLDRRPVDRVLAPGEAAFQDRTVELTATAEEAVVDKQARVVEEIGLRKDATERTETVRDTVRHTEVEVEDTRTGEMNTVTGATTTTSTTKTGI